MKACCTSHSHVKKKKKKSRPNRKEFTSCVRMFSDF